MSALQQINATGAVTTGVSRIRGLVLTADAAVAALELRDGASGDVLLTLKAATGASQVLDFGAPGIQCASGIHVTLTGTGAVASIHHG
ncbi:hypothetical protein BJF79_13770 [Actinomadura sp. CNU-125]|uniref:hypothetical protein n=1 Tax=Actinomadura sp. CNU-125 TaxID=1904961 RepID=UPI000962309A|nr:hypothetical protein [Actinomadura sp. CNU-125]OLT24405.1 hypothetical protein BJF79_13770 [Actinomadura sp. CNU-125]